MGSLTGCLDSARFPGEGERMEQAMRTYRLVFRPRPAAFFARSPADLAWAALRGQPGAGEFADARWPAHPHINVAPEARGTGSAGGLMTRWLDRLRKAGSPGCRLQTLVENTRAVRFFERMGFAEHGPAPPVPGLRHHGRRVHRRTTVWSAGRAAEEAGTRTSVERP